MDLISEIKATAKRLKKRIILPETNDERVLKAADKAIQEEIAEIILIGDKSVIEAKGKELSLSNLSKATIINPINHPKKEELTNLLMEIRKSKGLTREEADKLVVNPLFLACLLLKNGDADGEVAGSFASTADVLRPALQILKTKKGISVVSSCFMIIHPNKSFGQNGILFYGDCGVNPNPNAQQLAEIAICTADSARSIAGVDPKVAMLSFSTKGSASHPDVDKVIEATKIAKQMAPELPLDGELQGDAALIQSVADKKAPGSSIAGKANVLIFPDLTSGNIAYKLTERLANAVAIGPILQGIAAPVNDLSRGCSVEDIVISIAITANQAGDVK